MMAAIMAIAMAITMTIIINSYRLYLSLFFPLLFSFVIFNLSFCYFLLKVYNDLCIMYLETK